MGLLRVRVGARTCRWQVQLLFIAAATFQFSVALGQEFDTIFQYFGLFNPANYQFQVPGVPNATIQEIYSSDFILLGNNSSNALVPNSSLIPDDHIEAKIVYEVPTQLTGPNSLTSFSTMIDFFVLPSTFFQCTAPSPSDNVTVEGITFNIGSGNFTQGQDGGYLGWLNSTTNGQASTPYNFAVEVDFVQTPEFDDPPDAHLGLNKNSLTSVNTTTIPWLVGATLQTYSGMNLTLWIDYNGSSMILDVYLTGPGGPSCNTGLLNPGLNCKPTTPIVSTFIDLTGTISRDGMFVGVSASGYFPPQSTWPRSYRTQALSQINTWTFNSNGLAPDWPRNTDGTIKEAPRRAAAEKRRNTIILICAISIPAGLLVVFLSFIIYLLYRRNVRLAALAKKYEIMEKEKGILERGSQNFKYKVLSAATKGFSSRELLGTGGFGSVYKGRLILKGEEKPTDVAVKRISANSRQGAEQFLAEVKIIGQTQHRNLVRLRGWCHERGELLLVYDYMPNGSVNQHLYEKSTGGDHTSGECVLTWARRLKIMSGIAKAIIYLHEDWEQRVIHRDVKSSNVMLDYDFNARLGDFGLARISEHDEAPQSTVALVGTYGYMAPEFIQTLKATEKTDVYSFGAMMLELAAGKRPVLSAADQTMYDKILLVDWVWDLYRDDMLLNAVDCRLQSAYDTREMLLFLKIGLLCSHPDPSERPNMREVINIWKGLSPLPLLPTSKPVPYYALDPALDHAYKLSFLDREDHITVTVTTTDDGSFNNSAEKLESGKRSTGSPSSDGLRYRPSNTSLPF